MRKVVVRIKGGLGNQLFCYAAARRFALVNDAELVIDDVTGFARDRHYRRQYALDQFAIPVRKATPAERLEPFERYRRGIMKWAARGKPFEQRRYIEQEGSDFDERLLDLRVSGCLYLEGVWPSEGYFKDVEPTIRNDLRIVPPSDPLNLELADKVRAPHSVAIHVRWFEAPGGPGTFNLAAEYYRRAVALIEERVEQAHYFIFSDDPVAASTKLAVPEARATFVDHNAGDESAYADLWLMSQCKHFITANSTFSWWAAWLATSMPRIVIAPGVKMTGEAAMALAGEIPASWTQL